MLFFFIDLLSIEIGHSFATHHAGKSILMAIDESVDTLLSKTVDQVENTCKIPLIIFTRGTLNSFPHDTKSDKVHSPVDKVLNILVIKRKLGVKSTVAWDVGVHLVDDVDTVENDVSSLFVNKHASVVVDLDFRSNRECC